MYKRAWCARSCFANLRPVSNVVLLPCRTQLIEFGTAVARRLKSFSLETEIWFDKAIEFDRVRRATRQWHGSFSKVSCYCRAELNSQIMKIYICVSVLTLMRLNETLCLFWIWRDWIKFDAWNHSRATAVQLPCHCRVKFIWFRHGSCATFETGLYLFAVLVGVAVVVA